MLIWNINIEIRVFWCRGYYVSTVENNKSPVYNYVENQLKEDMISDQLTIKEYIEYYYISRIKSKLKGISPVQYQKPSLIID